MNPEYKKILNLFSRYISIAVLGLGNLYIIYKILIPLTVHTTNLILKLFTSTSLAENTIYMPQTTIQIVEACVAGSAFYLLIALLLAIPGIKVLTRTKAILTALTALFALNITRILILTALVNNPSFETIHWFFWHIVSTVLVAATYIATIKIYKIKNIPVIEDIRYLKSLLK